MHRKLNFAGCFRGELLEDRRVLNADISISEFLAVNHENRADEDGDFSDWIEIRNESDEPVSLLEWSLTDSSNALRKWVFPNVSIDANDYLLVFASSKDRVDPTGPLHTSFKLAGDGEYLALVNPESDIVSEFAPAFPEQNADVSYGHGPDGQLHYFSEPTPEAANSNDYADQVSHIVFDVHAGFYSDAFDLTLTTETLGAIIRYTTDGSVPTETNGDVFVSPLTISGSTVVRAVGFLNGINESPTVTQSYLFVEDVVSQSNASVRQQGFPRSWPNGPADYAMDQRVIGERDRYNGKYSATIRDDLLAVPSLSIVMDQDDLFGNRGIYANPEGRGVAWERPTSVEWIDPSGGDGFQIDAGIRIQGGISRVVSSKLSMRLLFKTDYGEPTLKFPIYGDDAASEFDSLALRGSGGEGFVGIHYIRDAFIRASQNDTGNPSPHSRFVHLYLNSVYWGMYEVTERADARFASNYFGGNKDDYDVLNAGDLGSERVTAIAGNLTAWNRLRSLANSISRGTTEEARRERYYVLQGLGPDGTDDPQRESFLDVDNYIDYLIVNWYSANSDWPHRNYYMSRLRGPESTGFKFFVWDAEFSLRNIPFDLSTFTSIRPPGPAEIFRGLYSSEDFRVQFSERIAEHFGPGGAFYVDSENPRFDPDNPSQNVPAARYAKIVDQVEEPLVAESARWGDNLFGENTTFTVDESWRPTVSEHMESFLPNRGPVFLDDMVRADLYRAPPTFSHPSGPIDQGAQLTLQSPKGEIFFTTDGSDPRLPNGDLNPTATRFESDVSTRQLISRGASWNYLDDGSDQGIRWRQTDFDDTDWDSGNAELGYGDGDEATRISFGGNSNNKHVTTYFRHEFVLENANQVARLALELKRDDGAIVFINEREVARSNLPAGPVNSETFATFAIGGAEEQTFFAFELPPNLLNNGTNLVAVEVHQANQGSSDVSFDLSLTANLLADVTPIEINENITIRARSRIDATTWSNVSDGRFLTHGVLADENNVRVTEINYHPHAPNPVDGMAELDVDQNEFEFIELTNVSDQTIDLFGMRFVDGVDFRFGAQLLQPGENIVVAKNHGALISRYGSDVVLATGSGAVLDDGVFSGQLNNNGEGIHLIEVSGKTIQQFSYNDGGSWPGRADGKASSLEIVNPSGDYDESENWRSSSEFGGSPGQHGADRFETVVVNEILAHTETPLLDSIELFNSSAASVDISGWYLSDSSADYFKYQIPANTSISGNGFFTLDENDFNVSRGVDDSDFSLSSFGDDVWVLASDAQGVPTAFVDHVEFQATLNGLSIGRLPNGGIDVPFVALAAPSLNGANLQHREGELIVSEVHFNPPGEDRGAEFIELYNHSSQTIDLVDWRLRGNVDFNFVNGQMNPAETMVLVDFDPLDETLVQAFRSKYAIGDQVAILGPWDENDFLSDDGASLSVQRRNDTIRLGESSFTYIQIDLIQFGVSEAWPASANGFGDSLQRDHASNFGWMPASWNASAPTPGSVEFTSSHSGDVNGDNLVDAADIDRLCSAILGQDPKQRFDVNQDGTVNQDDWTFLIEEILRTGPGDSNLDRAFDSGDLVLVFQAGEYEDGATGNSTWLEGDWNCDGDFTTGDLVAAFERGNYLSAASAAQQRIAAGVDGLFLSSDDLPSKKTETRTSNLHSAPQIVRQPTKKWS